MIVKKLVRIKQNVFMIREKIFTHSVLQQSSHDNKTIKL